MDQIIYWAKEAIRTYAGDDEGYRYVLGELARVIFVYQQGEKKEDPPETLGISITEVIDTDEKLS